MRTVEQYFADVYQKRLNYPHLPCLHVGPKEKHIYIPMEVMGLLVKKYVHVALNVHIYSKVKRHLFDGLNRIDCFRVSMPFLNIIPHPCNRSVTVHSTVSSPLLVLMEKFVGLSSNRVLKLRGVFIACCSHRYYHGMQAQDGMPASL